MRPNDIDTIRTTYDQIAAAYIEERDQFASLPYLVAFAAQLPPGAKVLDLGGGGGRPVAAWLADRGFAVQGLDLSPRMIAIATENVPTASFEVGNMLELSEGQFQVDGIVSFYAIFHTPREGHAELFTRLASFLPLRGALLVTMGASDWEGSESFHGSPMIWSHYGAERNRPIVESAGFDILLDEIDTSNGESHQIILALRR